MRVFWYWPWPAHRWLGVAGGVAAGGHRVIMQCFEAQPGEDLPLPPHGVSVLPELPRPRARVEGEVAWAVDRALLLANRARLRAWRLRTVGMDVCHVQLLQHLLDPALLGSVSRRQVLISTVHDLRPHHSRLPRPLEQAALRRLYSIAGHLVVYHRDLADGLVDEFGVDRSRITIVPHPVFPAHRASSRGSGGSVLFFGALRRNKGIPILLQAMATLGKEDLRLTIAGRGAPDVERMVCAAAGRDRRITAEIGYIPDEGKAELFNEADLVVLPYSAFTSQSGVLHDAYAFSRPALVTDVGALGSTVRADGTGWVVPPLDAEALAVGLMSALGDEPGRRAAARAAAKVADERAPEIVGRELASLYARLSGLGPKEQSRGGTKWASTS